MAVGTGPDKPARCDSRATSHIFVTGQWAIRFGVRNETPRFLMQIVASIFRYSKAVKSLKTIDQIWLSRLFCYMKSGVLHAVHQ